MAKKRLPYSELNKRGPHSEMMHKHAQHSEVKRMVPLSERGKGREGSGTHLASWSSCSSRLAILPSRAAMVALVRARF